MATVRKVVLDTNILLMPGQLKLDVFQELFKACNFNFELYIVDRTLEELDKILKKANEADKRAVRVAQQLIKQHNVGIIQTETGVDDSLASLSHEGYIIATNDIALKKRLHKPYIVLRQKKYFQLEE